MKTSMKLMVMTLVVAMLLSMSAFAASVSYVDIAEPTLNDAGTDYNVTLNYTANGYAAGDQVTLLVLIDSDEIIFDETDDTVPTNVIYIDQQTISATAQEEGAAALAGSFTFTVAKSTVENEEVYVKLGATSQATAAEGTSEVFVGGGESTGDVVLENGTNATVSNVSAGTETSALISAVYTVAITDAALAGKVPQAYVGDTAVGTVFYSTERSKYLVVLPAGTTGDVSIKAVDAANATVTNFIYGDTNGDGNTAAAEVNMATAQVRTNNTPVNTFARLLALDVNGDGNIAPADVNQLTAKARKKLTVYPIVNK